METVDSSRLHPKEVSKPRTPRDENMHTLVWHVQDNQGNPVAGKVPICKICGITPTPNVIVIYTLHTGCDTGGGEITNSNTGGRENLPAEVMRVCVEAVKYVTPVCDSCIQKAMGKITSAN